MLGRCGLNAATHPWHRTKSGVVVPESGAKQSTETRAESADVPGPEPVSKEGVRTTSVQVLDRVVALLETIAAAGQQGIALKPLTDQVGLRASTGRTLLSSLVAHGIAAQNARTRRYLLGPWFFELNRTYIAQSDLSAVAAPVLRELWEETRETVHLVVLHGTRRVDISVLVGPQLLNVNPTLGQSTNATSLTLHRTAAGKILVAGLAHHERSDLLAKTSCRTEFDEILAEMERVDGQGYATNLEEEEVGVCGVAAPVVDGNGRTSAALCIGYPAVRHTPDYAGRLRDAVLAAAARLSALLGADPKQSSKTKERGRDA